MSACDTCAKAAQFPHAFDTRCQVCMARQHKQIPKAWQAEAIFRYESGLEPEQLAEFRQAMELLCERG